MRGAVEDEPHEHTSHSRANRAVATPTGSVSQHPARAEEAAGVGVASSGRTGPGIRCVFRCAPVRAGLYGAQETARWSFPSSTEGKQAGIRRADRAARGMLRECVIEFESLAHAIETAGLPRVHSSARNIMRAALCRQCRLPRSGLNLLS